MAQLELNIPFTAIDIEHGIKSLKVQSATYSRISERRGF